MSPPANPRPATGPPDEAVSTTEQCVLPPPSVDARGPASNGRVLASWLLGLSVAAVCASTLQFASSQVERGFYLLSLCLVVCFAAAWSDVATRRIPNVLTYPAVLLGLVLNGLLPLVLTRFESHTAMVWLGSSGAVDCIAGFGLCSGIGIVSFMARGLGGGDVKLLAAVGAMLGFHSVVAILFNTLLCAALLGILNWTAGGALMQRMQGLAHAIYFSVLMRSDMRAVYQFKSTEGPFALSLFVGVVTAQFVALHRLAFGVDW